MKQRGLSVCLITKNEERFLARCLESVLPVANEIIVVDTGSTDKTIEIAKKYNAKVFFYKWCDDFASARNYAISEANFELILSIDADEELQNPISIAKIVQNPEPHVGGWFVTNISFASKRGAKGFDLFSTKLIRLFRNHPKIRFVNPIHEQIHESILELGYKLGDTDAILLHYGYALSQDEMQKKTERNLKMLLRILENDPTNDYMLFQTARTYIATNQLVEAEKYIQRCLQNTKEGSVTHILALNYGALIAFNFGNYQLAIERANQSLQHLPQQSFANFILGETYSALNNYEKALEHYCEVEKSLLNPDPMAIVVGDHFLPFNQLYFRYGRCAIGLRKPQEAELWFRKGLEIAPNDFDNLRGLANALVIQEKFEQAKEILNKFPCETEQQKQEIQSFLTQIERMEQVAHTGHIPPSKPKDIEHPTPLFSEKKSRPFLSLCMIVKNEEKFLSGCLESVQNLVDEIVIVDTGSTDSTKEIAKRFGARIYDFLWQDDFAIARNESLKYATGEWILYLDADERVIRPQPVQIKAILQNAATDVGAFYCLIESEHYQMDGSVELHRGGYPRIFRNLGYPRIRFIGRVHEQIAPSIFENNYKIHFSEITIRHLGYNQSREVLTQKVHRNYKMLIAHVQEEPLNGYAWYQLGQTLAQMSLLNEAEQAIRMAIQTGTLSKSVFASAASTLAKMVGNKGNYAEALHWAEKSLESAPEQIYALHLKAYALLYLGRFEEAETAFIEVLKRIQNQKGIPLAGFDIQIPEELAIKGLNCARNKIISK